MILTRDTATSHFEAIPLGDLVEFLDHKRKPIKADQRQAGEIPYYGANGIQGYVNDHLFDEPLILLAEDGGHFNNPERGIAYEISGKSWVNNHAHVIRPKSRIDRMFLLWTLKHYDVRPFVSGSTRPKLTKGQAEKIPIPVPASIDEQKRIAAILNEAAAVRQKCEMALDLADDFLNSVFLDMFGDPATNSKDLPQRPLSWFGQVITGNTPPRSNSKNYGEHIEWIKSDNINTPDHFLTNAKEKLSKEGEKLGRIAPAGSVLVTCIAGSQSSIGRAAIADRDVAFNQQINAIKPSSNFDTYFLYTQFLTGQKLIQSASTNSMKGMVSKSKFQEINFLAPTLEEQTKFGFIFQEYHKNKERLTSAKVEAKSLFNSLAVNAFRGEL